MSADPTRNGQIQSRGKRQKHSVSMARPKKNELIRQIRKQNSLRDRVSQRREEHSGVKSSTVHKKGQSSHWVRNTCEKSARPK